VTHAPFFRVSFVSECRDVTVQVSQFNWSDQRHEEQDTPVLLKLKVKQ